MHAGFHTGVVAGEGREVLGSKFLLATPTFSYAAKLFYQLENSTWCAWCSR